MAASKTEESFGNAVILPCEPSQFKDFIADLLGQPQTIERTLFGRFEVDRANIENLFHLIDQRIASQNDGHLIQFTARIGYDDQSSVLLNSFQDFVTYNEVRPLLSKRVHLTWTYLVTFRNKRHPEKQQISVGFRSGEMYESGVIEFGPGRRFFHEPIKVAIQHTDRSWGADLESLITNHLQTLLKHDPPLREMARHYSGWIGLFVFLTIFASTLFTVVKLSDSHSEKVRAGFSFTLSEPVTNDQIAKQSALILRWLIEEPRKFHYFLLAGVAGFVLSVVLGIFAASSADRQMPSFVLLSEKSLIARTRAYEHDKSNWRTFALSLLGAIGAGVLGNYVSYLIASWYLSQ